MNSFINLTIIKKKNNYKIRGDIISNRSHRNSALFTLNKMNTDKRLHSSNNLFKQESSDKTTHCILNSDSLDIIKSYQQVAFNL